MFTSTPSFVNLATRALPRPSATKILPCASHATSVGRLKRSCCAPAPGAPPPRPAPPSPPPPGPPARGGCGARAVPPRARRVLNRFCLAPEEKRDAPLRIELHDHRRHLVDDPEV